MTEAFRRGYSDAVVKMAGSLSDEELAAIAKHYNDNREDRPTASGDLGRYLLLGLPGVLSYDYNRTGGNRMLSDWFTRKQFKYKPQRKKTVDSTNLGLKALSAVLGGLSGAGFGNAYSDRDVEQNTTIGALSGAGTGLLVAYLAQKIAQRRARRMLRKDNEKQTV